MTLRSFNAVQRSIDEEHLGWAPNGLAVRQARKHLASLSPERRAALEAEWKQTVEYV